MMAESRSQRSAVADQRQLQQQLWREEREREQERIREAVMQKAGMVTQRDESHRGGGGGGGGQGGSGGSGTVVGVEEDPRAVQYREMIERKKREEREAEVWRLALVICTSCVCKFIPLLGRAHPSPLRAKGFHVPG